MKAGRELDALIVEKVFGEPNPPKKVSGASEQTAWILNGAYVPSWIPRPFSTQIADAKLTTSKVLEMPNVSEVVIVGRTDGGWNVGFLDNDGVSFAGDWGETEELARCLAALKATENA